jgi:hypothetical protein
MRCCVEHTIKTDSKSSRTRASWISSGIRSKGSCFAFPLDFGVVLEAPTRELRGARTKEVSAINDGSSRATRALVPIPALYHVLAAHHCLCYLEKGFRRSNHRQRHRVGVYSGARRRSFR